LHNNIFELKVHFDPMVKWRGLDKINVHRIYNLQFFNSHKAKHVYDSWNITQKRKIEKIMQCPFIKSLPLWYGSGFFLKLKYYYAFITKQMQKNTFFE
jgi:hypothetical protein